ncbi:MAG TPA: helix-turn-helix domain-containing protein [Blastocatellia bacterium]|nr:helix-turn-helix domain-containing protein [Blastocatellia bacterium]
MNEQQENGQSPNLESAIKALGAVIQGQMARPLYLKIEMRDGELDISQVEYLTTEEFAALVKADVRTVYGWFDRGLLKFCKPIGTGQNLIPLRAALHWIDSSEVKKEPKKKKGEAKTAQG